jgi:two-component system NarL family sensor kinase
VIPRLTTVSAWALSVVAFCPLGIMLVVRITDRSGAQPPVDRMAELAPLVAAIGAMAVVGSVIASRRPDSPIGWSLAGAAIAIGTAFIPVVVVQSPVAAASVGAASLGVLLWAGSSLLFLGLMLFALTLLLFPDGRLPSKAWQWPARVSLGALGAAVIAAALAPSLTIAGGSTIANPFGIAGPIGDALDMVRRSPWLQLVGLGLAVAAPVARYRTATGDARLQLRAFAFAASLVPIGLILAGTVLRGTTAGFYVMTIPFAGLSIAIGVAVLRYHLYDIDLLIGRAVLYGVLTACVVGTYVAIVGGLGALFQTTGNLAISLVATGIVAILFQPLRERAQLAVQRLFYGERTDPYRVLTQLGRRLGATLSPDEVLPTIAELTREALKLAYCAVAVHEAGRLVVAAQAGEPTSEPLRIPLTSQGEAVGELVLGPRDGQVLRPEEQQLLQDLARQFGVAVRAVRLTEALRRSRELLVTAREEERRKLRRDLHDGLGPRLAGLTLRLETARDRHTPDPETRLLLTELADRCRESVADIRRLIYGLRPPALDDLGLVSAIREGAAQTGTECGDLEVVVETPAILPVLPAAVEVAAYRIAQEALTNVARHSEARHCVVRLTLEGDGEALRVAIEDDGRGRDPDRPAGIGIASMRERAEELGGTWSIDRLPSGGTRVSARLPFRPPRAGDPTEATDLDAVVAK